MAVDYRLITRPQISDVAVQSFLTPQTVEPGQAFVLSAWVQAPTDQEVQYQLKRGDDIIASGSKAVTAGLTRLMFRDRAGKAGVSEYTVTIQGAQDDPVPENNTARALVGVEGTKPILVVSSAGDNSGLREIICAAACWRWWAKSRRSAIGRWEEVSQYSGGGHLEMSRPYQVGMSGMETLASWVENTGSGLAMTGGQKSYGPGGYFKSPLERVLPISMEMRKEHRKMSVAVVVALDRSWQYMSMLKRRRTH